MSGPLLCGGYWKLPDATAETFRDGWMHTGDMAREDEDGFWYIVDRVKDMIVTGGFNVFPARWRTSSPSTRPSRKCVSSALPTRSGAKR